MDKYQVKLNQACAIMNLERSSYYYKVKKKDDAELIALIHKVLEKNENAGFGIIRDTIRKVWDYKYNHKRIKRVYNELGLNLRVKSKKKSGHIKDEKIRAKDKNDIWSLDFIHAGKMRVLNVMDEYSKESLGELVEYSFAGDTVADFLRFLFAEHGVPNHIRCDNGSEFISYDFMELAEEYFINMLYIERGKPVQNCFIERFNRTFRNEVLKRRSYRNKKELQEACDKNIDYYNNERPHSSLGGIPPSTWWKELVRLKALNFVQFKG